MKTVYCKTPELIENYELAKKDNFKGWDIHHRLETHTSEGIKREVSLSVKELKALDMYYNRPADELIFLKHNEHSILHLDGHKVCEVTRKKLSDFNKGRKHSDEAKRKCSEAGKRGKGTHSAKGKHYFTNGVKTVLAFECPAGFWPRETSEELRRKLSESHIGQIPWNKKC